MNRARAVGLAVAAVALTGCSARSVSVEEARAIAAPTFAPLPATPIESPQLDVIVERNTAGTVNDEPDADPTQIAPALDAVRAAFPGTTLIGDLYVIERDVHLTIADPDVPGRTISLYYRDALSVGEPTFDDDTGLYPIESVDVDAIVALVQGLIERYPAMQIDMPRLDVGLSYGLELSWRIELNDARGTLATLWADLDGRVIAVETVDD